VPDLNDVNDLVLRCVIDTTHLISTGFSYGGGMSYEIACARAKVFHAVVLYEGGTTRRTLSGTVAELLRAPASAVRSLLSVEAVTAGMTDEIARATSERSFSRSFSSSMLLTRESGNSSPLLNCAQSTQGCYGDPLLTQQITTLAPALAKSRWGGGSKQGRSGVP
jgi:hypothetical protein